VNTSRCFNVLLWLGLRTVLAYKSLHGLAPQCNKPALYVITDITSRRRRLRSASSFYLEVPRTQLVTVGDRTFSAAVERFTARYRWVSDSRCFSSKTQTFPLQFVLPWTLIAFCFCYVNLEVYTYATLKFIYNTIQYWANRPIYADK